MSKKLVLAAVLAFATTGLATTANAGYGHKTYGYGHSYGYKAHSYGYKSYGHSYGYRAYKPVYVYNTYKPACHYGWTYKHGYKVWACIW